MTADTDLAQEGLASPAFAVGHMVLYPVEWAVVGSVVAVVSSAASSVLRSYTAAVADSASAAETADTLRSSAGPAVQVVPSAYTLVL